MRAVIQRVLQASVHVNDDMIASIGPGIAALIGIHVNDTVSDIDYIIEKMLGARIFDDTSGVMNLSLRDNSGELLVVSQFTLYGDIRKGRRPSYSDAMSPGKAIETYDQFITKCMQAWPATKSGIFGANMALSLTNDGPVTILVDSLKLF